MAATLGVGTLAYLPFCFFNIASFALRCFGLSWALASWHRRLRRSLLPRGRNFLGGEDSWKHRRIGGKSPL